MTYSRGRQTEHIVLAVILLMGLMLRCKGIFTDELGMNIQGDEGVTIERSYLLWQNFPDLPEAMQRGYTPLLFMILAFTFNIFGYSIPAARFVTSLLGTLTIVYVYLLGKSFRDTETGILAASLLAVQPHHVFYSRVAHNYVPAIFFGTGAVFHAYAGLKKQSWIDNILAGSLLLASVLTREFGFVFVGILAVWIFWDIRRRIVKKNAFPLRDLRFWCRMMLIFGLPILSWIGWILWIRLSFGVPSSGSMGGFELISWAFGSIRATSLLFLSTFPVSYLGLFLSILTAVSASLALLKEVSQLPKSEAVNIHVKTYFLIITSLSLIFLGIILQSIGILHGHSYLLRFSFWLGALIAFLFLLRVIFLRTEDSLPFIWVLVILASHSFLRLKLIRYLLTISPGLSLACSIAILDCIKNETPTRRILILLLLLATFATQLLFDLFGNWLGYSGWGSYRYLLWPIPLQ